MKKAIIIVLIVLALALVVGNAESIFEFFDVLQTGALVPILVSLVFMVVRHFTQAASYDAAFEAAGYKTGFMHNVKMIFSLVFINTFCLFPGAAGLAFLIDDAHRQGADIGTASSGGVLTQMGFASAVAIISIVGAIAMAFTGEVNPVFAIGGVCIVLVLIAEVSFFLIGYRAPKALHALFGFCRKVGNFFAHRLKKEISEEWPAKTADSFINSAHVLSKNPKFIVSSIAWALLSALCNMSCLIAIGFAFGFEQILPLIAAFAVAVVSISFSPTPQGIGVTEACITLVLTAYGATVATSAAIALVYRGIMLWCPFFVGAFMLSKTDFFKKKPKDNTIERRRKDTGWMIGTVLIIVGIVNIVLGCASGALAPYELLTRFVDFSNVFLGTTLIIGGVAMVALGVGLIKRNQVVWALTIVFMIFLCGAELNMQQYVVAFPVLALCVWLYAKRRDFGYLDYGEETANFSGEDEEIIELYESLEHGVNPDEMLEGSDSAGTKGGVSAEGELTSCENSCESQK